MQNEIETPTSTSEVSLIMTRHLTWVEPVERLQKLAELFKQVSFHHLPVTENGRLVGILSDRDVSLGLLELDENSDVTAQDIMSKEPITATMSTTIETASILLLENKISCLPVVDSEESLVGILTWKDLLRYYVYY